MLHPRNDLSFQRHRLEQQSYTSMPDFLNLLLFAVLVFVLVFGAGLLPFAKPVSAQPKVLYRMTCIAAGFLISAAMLIAIPEGFVLYLESAESGSAHDYESLAQHFTSPAKSQHDHGSVHMRAVFAGLAVLLGFVFMLILEGFGFGHDVHEEHHDHMDEHNHDHVNHPAEHSSSLVIGLTLHAITDGMVLAAAFSLGELALSLQLAVVVLMHKFPAAFSLAAYSLHERNSKKRSLLDLFFFACASPVAMVLTWFLFDPGQGQWQGLAVLFAAGSFIYVSTVDVLPSIHIRENSRQSLGLVLLGIGLMLAVSFLVTALFPDAAH